uniref:Retrotransposon protein, putative, Ty1-copia subclass n=1 Tax=Tanacetum cinerariifolium TaxID=118510 RepID=A0A6L2K200_TANCI|nr:hypothetical protein [Tanacetum cinerariifolium]
MECLNSNFQERELHQLQQMQDNAKESCMVSFQLLHSHLKALSNNDLKGTCIMGGFEWAFVALFDQDIQAFTGSMLLNFDQLEKQLDKEEFQKTGSIDAFRELMTQFQTFINFRYYFDDFDGTMICKYFQAHTRIKIRQFRDTLIHHMKSLRESILERAKHKREKDKRVNDRMMQSKERKDNSSKALDVGLVVTESNETESKSHVLSNRSENDTHTDDADINSVNDKQPMAEILNETGNEANIKREINVLEARNIDLEITPHYLPKVKESALAKPHHVNAPSSSRNSQKELYSSNDMAHNYYLEEAKKKTHDKNRKLKPREMPSAKTHHTLNSCKPKPKSNNQISRNWHASKSYNGASDLVKSGVSILVGLKPIPTAPVVPTGQHVAPEILTAHTAWIKGSKEIVGLMLMTMELDIQRNLETLHAHEMLLELKTLFAQQVEQELLQTTRDFHSCKQEEGQSVSSYVLKMKGYIDNLERLGHPVTLGLGLHEKTLPKNNAHVLHAIRAGKVQKVNKHKKSQPQMAARGQNHEKGKNKLAYAPKPKIPPPPKSEDPAKDSICHECGETGHWKRNCPQYLAELLKKKKNTASGAGSSGIFVIELNTILNRSWIYDTGCGTHICNTMHGLRAGRKLKLRALSLYVGNGQRKAVEAIGVFYLCLPSGLEIVLNNCHYAPSITGGVISVSRLYEDGLLTASNKRAKLDLDSALLWHCRLGHISNKRIEKLQHDGLLNSTDLRAFEKCVSCMSGKMERKPYTHQVERAKDLLRLIHNDVCGPFKIMSRQRASYFFTFANDFSRYGYGYLLKHEVFETFKLFQKEVENQVDHRIIAHRTPPYTPQHNGVSEKRNRTLLDMVRSMMSQTTLLKSFWYYALETGARILNMVPTKMVEKTPYEVWHGQAPKLSYLKVWGYPNETMGYSFYYPPENKVLVARNAEFLENSHITQEASGSLEDLEIIQEEDTHPSIDTSLNHEEDDLEIDEPQSDIIPIRRSTKTRHAPDRMCLYINAEEHELGDLGEPANYKAALLDPESAKWLNAMNVEMQSMKDNEVWVLVELPHNGKTVDIRAIRILIAIAAYYDYEIWQMDVKTAFLNGYLNEEVYMEQPESFVNPKYPNRRYCMENSKRGSIPMQEKLKLSKSQGASTPAQLKRMQNVPYASAVGSIMYVVRCTRPDVAFTQNVTSRFQQNPGVTGYVFVLNGGVVDWKSAKQSIFATSSTEAEYIAAFDASKEALEDGGTLADYNIHKELTLHLCSEIERRNYDQRQDLTRKEIEIDIEPTDTIDGIKERVEEKEGIPPVQQQFAFFLCSII